MAKTKKKNEEFLSDVATASEFAYPYTPEKFTAKEKKILLQFFSNWDRPVFAIHNLPQEVVGAMFSRYSRTAKSVRRLFLDEFWNENINIKEYKEKKQTEKAIERTKNFYRRVFAEYGDDSVIQMGSVHIAFEYVSQIAVKAIEDSRVASAYIEKSTRYVDFGGSENGRFLYIDIPELKESKFEKEVAKWDETAFKYYVKSFPITYRYFRKIYPLKDQVFLNPQTGLQIVYKKIKQREEKEKAKKAYERALKARSFDAIRYFLPLTVVSNLGAHFSGQAAENCINKMLSSKHEEVRFVGKLAARELEKVSSNFLQHVSHKYGEVQRDYRTKLRKMQEMASEEMTTDIKNVNSQKEVAMVQFDEDADIKLAAQVIFVSQQKGLAKSDIVKFLKELKTKDLKKNKGKRFSPRLINFLKDSIPDRKKGFNRRHKLPRAFEHVYVEMEFLTDYGVYKDLQRNRLSSTERTPYLAKYVKVPKEYKGKGMEKVQEMYKNLSKITKDLQSKLLKNDDPHLRSVSEYIMLHGNKVRFNIKANLRQWVFFAELRTIEGGHPAYRLVMQKAAKEIIKVYPFMKRYFAHVNWTRDTGLGRLRAEVRTQEKLDGIVDTRF